MQNLSRNESKQNVMANSEANKLAAVNVDERKNENDYYFAISLDI